MMVQMISIVFLLFLATAGATIRHKPLATVPGEQVTIPNWDFHQVPKVSKNTASLSLPNINTFSWHHAPVSRCTLMACLQAEGTFGLEGRDGLWYSENLAHFDQSLFSVPWVYRNQFNLETGGNRHYFLQTNGITPAADLFFNGKQIADNITQSGSYGGHTFDITGLASEENAVVVKVYPTDYQHDFAVGFVDWNPYPPDNGTGVWRDITIKQTGDVFMGPLSILTKMDTPIGDTKTHQAVITVRAQARNLSKKPIKFVATANIKTPKGKYLMTLTKTVRIGNGESSTIQLSMKVQSPEIWWPAAWGQQPLYSTQLIYSIGDDISDMSPVTKFGIRTVTSELNAHNDTLFRVNGYPIQIRGGGYTSDMFLRWDPKRFENIARYVLDMGMNTIRLEGKMEQPELYEIADRLGLMLMAGWECCDRWESWPYNHDLAEDPPPRWYKADYETVNASIRHEATMMQTHPSVIAFLVGSDYWPDERATKIYLDGLRDAGWQVPIISSAAKRGYPKLLKPSGMKMEGPYDWVPPVYWFDREPTTKRFGSSFGFGSELGAGVGTPTKGSLVKFLTDKDMQDLWKKPNKGLYHMSQNTSQFYDRSIYNKALFTRYGKPTSLDDYLMSTQMMDYEATRSQFEGYGSQWSASRPATGLIYWMLNNAWPSLHWNQFDYYLHPAGSYFGTKIANSVEHVAFDYFNNFIWLINRSLKQSGTRSIHVELVDLDGERITRQKIRFSTEVNKSRKIGDITSSIKKIKDVGILRLLLIDESGNKVLSRNAYWISKQKDVVDWASTTWYWSDVKQSANFTALSKMDKATITITAYKGRTSREWELQVNNTASVPAVFIQLNLIDKNGDDVTPLTWSDNYFTLLPHEVIKVKLSTWSTKGALVEVIGKNVDLSHVQLR
ncbi:related to beta-mannosidase [Fusarium torulosum]|uniref:Related to beta-mannosidase n=1 Tax=Fusarium torulosum TaxID=33205 RepID=A0AAE8MHZ4_9HYPO|nr:related to beta-mannosidase [Fusarium torulosum]